MSIPILRPNLPLTATWRTEWQGMVYFPTGETAEWGPVERESRLSLFGPCRAHYYPRRRKKPDWLYIAWFGRLAGPRWQFDLGRIGVVRRGS